MFFRSCLLALLCPLLLGAGCGGTAPRPKLDGSGAGGSEGGQGGEPGDETGGAGGSQAGSGAGGRGGAGGSGTGGSGGAGGSGNNGSGGGSGNGGAGGSSMGGSGMGGSTGGSGGAGASDAPADVKQDTAGTPGVDAPIGSDSPPAVDTPPADIAPAADTPPVGASCGGVNCLRLWQLVESCRPMGACVQQTAGTLVNRCYANQVKVRAKVMALSNTISTTFVKTDGTNCYLMDTPLLGGGGVQTLVIKELNGTEVARVTITESTAISCGGGSPQTLNDSACLPPFSLTECAQGDCQ